MNDMLGKIKKVTEKNPNVIAYRNRDEEITYGKLWDNANLNAELLKKQGSEPVIIYGDKEINFVVSILSCIIAERTYIPVSKNTPICRIEKMIDMSKASLILTSSDIDVNNIDCCTLSDLNRYAEEDIKLYDNDIVYIIFTSGSTGDPKGVPISKKNLNNFINWISNIKPLDEYKQINVLNQANFSFDLSVADLFYSLCNGHTLVALNNENAYNDVYDTMKDNNINVSVLTPTFIKFCLLNNEFNEKNYPDLKCIYFCGEQLETRTVDRLFRAFPNLNIVNAYGPTEATSAVSAILITKDMLNNELLPVGDMQTSATDISLIDNEIVLKGDSVFNGYIGGMTGGYYKENNINCFKTGDLGYISDGLLYCRGRKDSQVKYKGYRIELNDIKNNICSIPGVEDCEVIAKYDNDLVKTIKAFVIANEAIDGSYVKDELKKKLPDYMIPKTIKILEEFPVNQNGKTDRLVLKEL